MEWFKIETFDFQGESKKAFIYGRFKHLKSNFESIPYPASCKVIDNVDIIRDKEYNKLH